MATHHSIQNQYYVLWQHAVAQNVPLYKPYQLAQPQATATHSITSQVSTQSQAVQECNYGKQGYYARS